jgi:hypothetical protein
VVSTSTPTTAFSAFQTGPLLLYSSNYSVYPITRQSGPSSRPQLPQKNPKECPGIEPGTSVFVVFNANHRGGRLWSLCQRKQGIGCESRKTDPHWGDRFYGGVGVTLIATFHNYQLRRQWLRMIYKSTLLPYRFVYCLVFWCKKQSCWSPPCGLQEAKPLAPYDMRGPARCVCYPWGTACWRLRVVWLPREGVKPDKWRYIMMPPALCGGRRSWRQLAGACFSNVGMRARARVCVFVCVQQQYQKLRSHS